MLKQEKNPSEEVILGNYIILFELIETVGLHQFQRWVME